MDVEADLNHWFLQTILNPKRQLQRSLLSPNVGGGGHRNDLCSSVCPFKCIHHSVHLSFPNQMLHCAIFERVTPQF